MNNSSPVYVSYTLLIILIIIILINLCGCFGQSQGFYVEKINEVPINYITFNENSLRLYPKLKEAIQNIKNYVNAPYYEFYEVRGILNFHDTDIILYNKSYYKIGLFYQD